MLKKPILLSSIIAMLITSTAAYADNDGRRHHRKHGYSHRHDWHHKHHHHRHHARSGVNFYFGSYYPVYPVYRTTYVQTVPVYAQQPVYVQQPVQTVQNDYCREYTGPIRVGSRIEQGYGTACLQPDGSWQIID